MFSLECILFYDVLVLQVWQTTSNLFFHTIWKSLTKHVEQNKSEVNFPFTSNGYRIRVK